MDIKLQVGLCYETEIIVGTEHTAEHYGSGLLPVLATPCMIGLMEYAAMHSVKAYLETGLDTVGTKVDIIHSAATPLGMKVRAKARLKTIDGRRLVFDVEAFDEREKIGSGVHERFIIQKEKFLQKVISK